MASRIASFRKVPTTLGLLSVPLLKLFLWWTWSMVRGWLRLLISGGIGAGLEMLASAFGLAA